VAGEPGRIRVHSASACASAKPAKPADQAALRRRHVRGDKDDIGWAGSQRPDRHEQHRVEHAAREIHVAVVGACQCDGPENKAAATARPSAAPLAPRPG